MIHQFCTVKTLINYLQANYQENERILMTMNNDSATTIIKNLITDYGNRAINISTTQMQKIMALFPECLNLCVDSTDTNPLDLLYNYTTNEIGKKLSKFYSTSINHTGKYYHHGRLLKI